MALFATINSESLEINLQDTVLTGYHFSTDTSGYAKPYPHFIKLYLDINVLALLGNKTNSLEENEKLLENLRLWGSLKYSGPDCAYYRKVVLTHTYGEELFREIWLNHAYVENYAETIELSKRTHVIRLELMQKGDRLRYER